MKNERVAVLDIRSFEVTFLVGGRGINDTFVVCESKSRKYLGYTTEGFTDKESFVEAVSYVVDSVRQNYGGVIDGIYVSVPPAFTTVRTLGHSIAFPSKRKITNQDLDELYATGLNKLLEKGRCIRQSAMYFALSDNRKYFDASALYGIPTSSLKGALCYYFITDEFHSFITETLGKFGVKNVKFIPSSLAQVNYLVPAKIREGYAVFIDMGFMTSSVSVVYGNGIVKETSYDCGIAWIIEDLQNKFKVSYEKAEEIFESADLSTSSIGEKWSDETGKTFSIPEINEIIKDRVNALVESADVFFQAHDKGKTSDGVLDIPTLLTGEGSMQIMGLTEHISSWLNRVAEIVQPDLPYCDKPEFSSRIALLNMALGDKTESGFFHKLRNLLGGKKK